VSGAQSPRIAVLGKTTPAGGPPGPELFDAVTEGGGTLVDGAGADGIVWVDPGDPDGLRDTLEDSPARWIQLPFAGIEPFVTGGVIDSSRVWTCAKGIYGESCAEHALAFMLIAAHRMHDHLRASSWMAEDDKSREQRFHGRASVVIVGTGGIGRSLASMLVPFEANVVAVNRSGRELAEADRSVTIDRLPEVLPNADYVVLAASTTDETKGMFDAAMLARMKPEAWLVNVARGALVDTDALVEALETGIIGGAALDVTAPEPLPDSHPLWSLDNAMITPHVANTWVMGLPALSALVARNVAKFAAGEELEGLVDPELGY